MYRMDSAEDIGQLEAVGVLDLHITGSGTGIRRSTLGQGHGTYRFDVVVYGRQEAQLLYTGTHRLWEHICHSDQTLLTTNHHINLSPYTSLLYLLSITPM